MTERITISLPDEMAESIHEQLSYGDNRSEWVRDAIEEKLDRESHETDESHFAIDNRAADGETRERVELPVELADALGEYREMMSEHDEPPGRLDDRAAAARAIMEAMVEHDGVGKSEALDTIHPKHPVEDQNEDTWWKKNAKKILGDSDLECVEYYGGQRNEYVYVG